MFDLKKCFVQETYSYVSNKESYGDRERAREREGMREREIAAQVIDS